MTDITITQQVVVVRVIPATGPTVALQVPAAAQVRVIPTGARGAGVPLGGSIGQVLAKTGSGDNETGWVSPAGGGGGVRWSEVTEKPTTFPPESHSHSDATVDTAGFMSAADKAKLDGLTLGGGTIPYAYATLGGDVNLAANNTWYDGPAITLAAGTWTIDISGHYRRYATGAANVAVRAFGGATVYAHGETSHPSVNGAQVQVTSFGVAILTDETTITLQMLTSSGSAQAFMKADTQNNPQGNKATSIRALRLE